MSGEPEQSGSFIFFIFFEKPIDKYSNAWYNIINPKENKTNKNNGGTKNEKAV